MEAFALVLAIPLVGALLLALWGHRNFAPELNAGISLGSFLAAA